MIEELKTDSSVRGYLVYQDSWTPVVGEQLLCEWKEGNPRDRHAVAIKKSEDTVGHMTHNLALYLLDHCDVSCSRK